MAIQLTKKGLPQALDADFGKQLYWEYIAALRATLESEDHAEAVEVFLAKRKPVFKGSVVKKRKGVFYEGGKEERSHTKTHV